MLRQILAIFILVSVSAHAQTTTLPTATKPTGAATAAEPSVAAPAAATPADTTPAPVVTAPTATTEPAYEAPTTFYVMPSQVPSAAELQYIQQQNAAYIAAMVAAQQQQQQQQAAAAQAAASALGSLAGAGGKSGLNNKVASPSQSPFSSNATGAGTPAAKSTGASGGGNAGSTPTNQQCSVVMDCAKKQLTITLKGAAKGDQTVTGAINCGGPNSPSYNGDGTIGNPESMKFFSDRNGPDHQTLNIDGIAGMGRCNGGQNDEVKVIHALDSGSVGSRPSNGCIRVEPGTLSTLTTACVGGSLKITGASQAPPNKQCTAGQNYSTPGQNYGTPGSSGLFD